MAEKHRNILISPNGNYNFNLKHLYKQPIEQIRNKTENESLPTITLLENGYLINQDISIPYEQILNYLANDKKLS